MMRLARGKISPCVEDAGMGDPLAFDAARSAHAAHVGRHRRLTEQRPRRDAAGQLAGDAGRAFVKVTPKRLPARPSSTSPARGRAAHAVAAE